MSIIDPKEIIGISKIKNWDSVKNVIKSILRTTLKDDTPYNVIIFTGNSEKATKSKSSQKSDNGVKNLEILTEKDLNKINDIGTFNTVSFYQSDGYIKNHIHITRDNDLIVMIAKYMGVQVDHAGSFDFSVILDSKNNPRFTTKENSVFNCKDIIYSLDSGLIKFSEKRIKDLKDEEIDKFVFECVSGKNAIWGGAETKAFTKWKDDIGDSFKESTEKYAYYGGNVTRRFREYLELMYEYWVCISENPRLEIDLEKIEMVSSFLKSF